VKFFQGELKLTNLIKYWFCGWSNRTSRKNRGIKKKQRLKDRWFIIWI